MFELIGRVYKIVSMRVRSSALLYYCIFSVRVVREFVGFIIPWKLFSSLYLSAFCSYSVILELPENSEYK